jgi:hypothetical protein
MLHLFSPRKNAPSFRSAPRPPSARPGAVKSSATPISRGARGRRGGAQGERGPPRVIPIIRDIQKAGATSLRAIAEALNARGIPTPRGKQWEAASVRNALARA